MSRALLMSLGSVAVFLAGMLTYMLDPEIAKALGIAMIFMIGVTMLAWGVIQP